MDRPLPAPEAGPAGGPAAPGGPPGWLEAALIAAAVALAYANSLDAPFHFDDFAVFADASGLRDLSRLWPPRGARWLGDVTFALNLRLGGLAPPGFHLVNLAVHAGNALLLLALARTVLRTPALRGAAAGPLLRPWLPLTAALLFALHPLATQAVTYVVQRYAALATTFFLASLLGYLRARMEAGAVEAGGAARRAGGRAAGWYALSLLAAVCAMKTKEIAFPLPAVALAAEALLLDGPRRRFLAVLPLAATALLVPLAHLPADGAAGPARLLAETEAIPRGAYLLTQAGVVVTYLRLLAWPAGQHLDWDVPLVGSPLDPAFLLPAALLAALAVGSAALLVRARRTGRAEGVLLALGVGWFLATVALESSVIPIRDLLVEHRTYLPSAGFALAAATGLLAGLGALRLRLRPELQAGALLALTAAPLGWATHLRNEVWRDDVALWRESAARSPGKARPLDSLGVALLERGRVEEAIPALEAALALRPDYPEALVNLAGAYRLAGRAGEALRLQERAVALAPGFWQARHNLGAMYEGQGRLDEALAQYREAARLAPARPEPAQALARLRARAEAPGPAR